MTHVTIINPDDFNDPMPLFDGELSRAGLFLEPGTYQTFDGGTVTVAVCIGCAEGTAEGKPAKLGDVTGVMCPDCAYHNDGNLIAEG